MNRGIWQLILTLELSRRLLSLVRAVSEGADWELECLAGEGEGQATPVGPPSLNSATAGGLATAVHLDLGPKNCNRHPVEEPLATCHCDSVFHGSLFTSFWTQSGPYQLCRRQVEFGQ